MNISHETPTQTDARLRRVLAISRLDVDERPWWYQELAISDFPARVRDDAIAVVRDADAWSQLVPVRPGDSPAERIRVWTFHFPPDVDNSGFVGWLASHIKGSTGSGVVVVCGQNANAGGIYDHWGCPEGVAEAALDTVKRLADGSAQEPDMGSPGPFDGLEMEVAVAAAAGEVGVGTRLSFEQRGQTAWARYAGGGVAMGFLVGRVDGASLDSRYVQIGTNGQVHAGHSKWELGAGPDGRVELTERFRWDTRSGDGTNVYRQAAVHDSVPGSAAAWPGRDLR